MSMPHPNSSSMPISYPALTLLSVAVGLCYWYASLTGLKSTFYSPGTTQNALSWKSMFVFTQRGILGCILDGFVDVGTRLAFYKAVRICMYNSVIDKLTAISESYLPPLLLSRYDLIFLLLFHAFNFLVSAPAFVDFPSFKSGIIRLAN